MASNQDPGRGSAAGARDGREFVFTPADFERIRKLIYQLAGISLSDMKHDLVYGRLARRLRACGLVRFSDYLDLVQSGDPAEREAFTNALTTNLTSFFREAHHFPILAEQAAAAPRGRPFRVWCSACSTGEEAYSIAITLAEVFGDAQRFEIVASDLDTQVLATARAGIYPMDRVGSLSADRLRNFFLRGTGAKAGFARVRSELVRTIRFERINLLDGAWPDLPRFDAIFCRNVMIYFDKPTQRKMLQRFVPLIEDGGRLYCGHSESLQHCADFLRNLGKTVYVPVGKAG